MSGKAVENRGAVVAASAWDCAFAVASTEDRRIADCTRHAVPSRQSALRTSENVTAIDSSIVFSKYAPSV